MKPHRPLTWRAFVAQLWERLFADEVFGHAAQISYYFFLALFPMLLFLTTLLGLFAREGSALRASLLGYFASVMPAAAAALVANTLDEISRGAGSGKLSFSLLAALWAASSGIDALTAALNKAYDVAESRPYWRAKLVSLFLTVALAALTNIALLLVLYGGYFGRLLQARLGLGDTFLTLWHLGQWPFAALCMTFVFNLLYYFAPNRRRTARWQWFTPGAFTALGLWLLISYLFRVYLNHFNTYNKTYGSLGAVIVLLLWFYFMGAAIIFGAEINQILTLGASPADKNEPAALEEPAVDGL